MNILYIQNTYPFNIEIESAFISLGHSLISHPAPPIAESDSAAYLESFLSSVKSNIPHFVFSCGFSPFLSLACGAIGLPYISWLIDSYDSKYYSFAIKNDWNYIFTIDSQLCKELKQIGVKHIYFLPLAIPTAKNTNTTTSKDNHYVADVSLIGTILTRDDIPYSPLNPASPLKDSSKGYLEGCIACQYQLHNTPSICNILPAYVWEDLTSSFPINNLPDLESLRHHYDYNYFNPLITYAERELFLNSFTRENRYNSIHLYSDTTSYNSPVEKYCGWADPYKDLPAIAKHSKINLVIAHRNYKAAIPPTAWAIISAQGFLLSNFQADYDIFKNTSPVLFQTEREMLSKAAYYYHHDEERLAISEALYQEALQMHTYQNRITEMLSLINLL